jgi:hypothetical protein
LQFAQRRKRTYSTVQQLDLRRQRPIRQFLNQMNPGAIVSHEQIAKPND